MKKLTTYVNYANYLCERYSSNDGYFSVHTEHHDYHAVWNFVIDRAGGRSKIQPRQDEGCQVRGGGGGGGAEALKVYVSPKIYPGNCLGCLLGSAGHD